MTVILNEAALARLLDSQEGPVGQFVQQRATVVVAAAQQNIRDYFASAPSLDVDQDVDFTMIGSTAVIGIRDAGNKSQRLARAQQDGTVNWLRRALEFLR